MAQDPSPFPVSAEDFDRREDWRELITLAEAVARAAGAGDAAEDIASLTMKRLISQQGQVENRRAWVRQTARNAAIDLFRRQPSAGWSTFPDGASHDVDRPLPDQLRMRSVSGIVGARDQLDRALEVLNEIEQQLLVGQHEGYSVKELAEMYGYTEGSVRTKLSVTRCKLNDAFPDLDLA